MAASALQSEKGIPPMAKLTVYPASETPYSDVGWRDMYRMFSRSAPMGNERRNFGVLHVFNCGTIQPGEGYPMHSHRDVEIVTIPLEGTWNHEDNEGNSRTFGSGQVQLISAGTGLPHSELNASDTEPLTSMQFWLFAREHGKRPRYELYDYREHEVRNQLNQVVSPNDDDEGVRIDQDAWFSIGKFDEGISFSYSLHSKDNGVFVYVTRGEFEIQGRGLTEKDALGIEESDVVEGLAVTANAEFVLIEVPMEIGPESLYMFM